LELISNLKTLLSKSQILSVLLLKLISIISTIYITVYLTKKIGLDIYGLFEISNRFIAIGILFCAFGFYDYVIRELSILVQNKNTKKIAETIYPIIILALFSFVILGVILLLNRKYIITIYFENKINIETLFIIISIILINIFNRILANIFLVKEKFIKNQITLSFFNLPFCIILLTIIDYLNCFNFTLNLVLIILLISNLIGLFYTTFFLRKELSIVKIEIKNLNFIYPIKSVSILLLIGLFHNISTQGDILIFKLNLSVEQIAAYSICLKIGAAILLLHSTLIPLISPRITRYYASGEHQKIESLLRVSSTFVFFISLSYTILIIFYSEEILKIWDVNILEMKLLLYIILLANLIETITGACGFTLIATNNEKKLLWITLSSSVIGLFLMFYLSKKFGMIGASISYLSTVFLNNIIKVIYLWHKLNIISIPTLMLKKEINYLMKKI
jgi:O-antigen/teichoic acid export membrane protein